jgi:hypothetical protein
MEKDSRKEETGMSDLKEVLDALALEMNRFLVNLRADTHDRKSDFRDDQMPLKYEYSLMFYDGDECVAHGLIDEMVIKIAVHVIHHAIVRGDMVLFIEIANPKCNIEEYCRELELMYKTARVNGEMTEGNSAAISTAYLTNPHITKMLNKIHRKKQT